MVGNRPVRLHRADRSDPIEIGRLHGESGRGNPMPAILLASVTHQRGRLHVQRSAPDEGGRSTQSNTIHNWFQAELTDRAPAATNADGVSPSAVASMSEPAKQRNAELVEGVEEVYRRMRSLMLPALERGLLEYEKPYYESIAAREASRLDEDGELSEDWQLDVGDLGRVFRAARDNNDQVMEGYGVKVGS
jgi:hypothetical protein